MEGAPSHNDPESAPGDHHTNSNTGLMSSVKVLGGATQSVVSNKSLDGVDKPKVAGAAEDVLGAAKQYGHLDEKGAMGQYVGKAEGYLHKVHSSDGTTTTTTTAAGAGTTTGETGGDKVPKEGDEEKKSGGSGMGDYVTMAKGFLGK